MEKKSISKEEIRELPMLQYEGEIILVNTEVLMLEVLKELESEQILGFDTETKPAFRKGESYLPSLLQLSGMDKVYVIQLNQVGNLDRLFDEVLGNDTVIKAGVAIRDDLVGLRKLHKFEAKGFEEIADIATGLEIENKGLRGLAALLMGGRISKSEQTSNWGKEKLSQSQLRYAATDAWISREIYLKLRD